MEVCCDLEVDVNGEQTFFVNKKTISAYSGKFRNMFGKSTCPKRNLKVIFNDFPGRAESFELIAQFCYSNGKISVTPSNIALLHCAGKFMEMNCNASDTPNLLEQTEKSMDEIKYWTWSELLVALKQCQNLDTQTAANSLVEKCLDSLVGKLGLALEASPCPSTCSTDSSGFRLSCDSKNTESFKNSVSRTTWWFEELLVFSPDLTRMLVRSMVSRKFDHFIISRFLLYYQKSKLYISSSSEKQRILETTVDALYVLDQTCVSCKSLFGILRVALGLNISKSSRNKLESMIGCQLDQATLDNLLVPSPYRSNYLFDVNLVLRFVRAFLGEGRFLVPLARLQKVASLMDLYIAEVAPDPCLKPSKFLALATIVPDSARDSHDQIYHVMDMYLEVHAGITENEKLKICRVLNHEKLSSEAGMHMSRNAKFSVGDSVQAPISEQSKLKSLTQSTRSSLSHTSDEQSQRVVLHLEKLEISSDGERLRERLQGIQTRVMELEKACRKMQTQMAKIKKSRSARHGNARSLPKLCS